jgi:Multicopper oxidase
MTAPTARFSPILARRRFVQGAAAAGVFMFLPWPFRRARAAPAPVLSGAEFQLEIGLMPINITGRPQTATAINGHVPGPILRWREGDTVTLAVTNRLSEPTSIHWHGVRVRSPMDGVPGLSFAGIPPGQTFVYRFPVRQNGTYFRVASGLAGASVDDASTCSVRRCASPYGQHVANPLSGLCCPNRVCHSCAASPDRPWLPNGAFVGRLVFHLRIELGAE